MSPPSGCSGCGQFGAASLWSSTSRTEGHAGVPGAVCWRLGVWGTSPPVLTHTHTPGASGKGYQLSSSPPKCHRCPRPGGELTAPPCCSSKPPPAPCEAAARAGTAPDPFEVEPGAADSPAGWLRAEEGALHPQMGRGSVQDGAAGGSPLKVHIHRARSDGKVGVVAGGQLRAPRDVVVAPPAPAPLSCGAEGSGAGNIRNKGSSCSSRARLCCQAA